MMKRIVIIVFSVILILSCNQVEQPDEEKLVEVNEIDNELGPPFSDTCLCSFNYIGKMRIDESRYDLILSGKRWDPEFYSCSWTLGELIYNEFPPDTLVTDFRVHLIDVDELTGILDSSFFESDLFKNKLIVTYSKNPDEEHMAFKFDPNKTGKYPKPKQWKE